MFDVMTFGSATSDTFLRLKGENTHTLKNAQATKEHNLCVCVPFGSKVLVEDLMVHSGGGGTNAACTFSSQGFKTAYVGKVGQDAAGRAVIDDLKRFKVSTSFVKKDSKYKTAISIVLSPSNGERTALVYQGACHFMEKEDIPWGKIKKAKWLYIGPLREKSRALFEPLVKFAKEKNIKVASNLSNEQISLGFEALKPVLGQVDVLILNREEAGLLSGLGQDNERAVVKKLSALGAGMLVLTKGEEGSIVYDGSTLFEAGVVEVKVVEKAGAGDAFGSGFIAGLLIENDIEYALKLATANAAGCIQQVGAKNGLLGKKDLANLPKVVIKKLFLYG